MTTTIPFAPIGAAAPVCAQGPRGLVGGRARTASTALVAPIGGLHATGLSATGLSATGLSGAGMPLAFRDDATGLPPRGAPV